MATSPIVTTQDLTDFQGGDAQSLIDAATALVRRYCGWHVTPVISETVRLQGSGVAIQMLPSLRVTEVTSVTYDGDLLSADDYDWSEVGVLTLLRNGPYFSEYCGWPTKTLEVELKHGFDYAEDFAAVILGLASRGQVNPNGVKRSQAGPYMDEYGTTGGFLPDEMSTLDLYKLPPRP